MHSKSPQGSLKGRSQKLLQTYYIERNESIECNPSMPCPSQLTQECINTRMSVYGRGARGGHAVVEIMAGIGRACPRLRQEETVLPDVHFSYLYNWNPFPYLQNPEPIGGFFPQSGVPHLPLLQGRRDFNMPYKKALSSNYDTSYGPSIDDVHTGGRWRLA